ncbi:uncharacterized protein LOC106716719 [Papilio machaon]|uniref:uncharacterized protein LOC106716719 n=1 Tax=Papilio machaon TaxID=76193 RepID=UPI001E663773|nr:uncharacterized protein LOC106716719 [Papilio machaon]
MKSVVVLSLIFVLATAVAGPAGQYTDRYDNINIDEILENRRLLIPYVHCLLEQGKCTPEGKELKSHIKEALENNCAKCTPPQRTRSRQVIGHLINHEPTFWNELCQKYDPTHKYTRKYEQELRTIAAMNSLTVVCLLAAVAIATAMPSPSETYTDRFDNIDLDEIIANRRLLVPYIHCVLDKGKCTPDGKELKSHIAEAIENDCAKCTEVQRKGTRKVLGHLINNEQEFWNELTARYDPEHKYSVKYENELRTSK